LFGRLDVRKLYGSKCLACASDQELVCGVDDGDISAVHPTDRYFSSSGVEAVRIGLNRAYKVRAAVLPLAAVSDTPQAHDHHKSV
jgi:hypothetical protein